LENVKSPINPIRPLTRRRSWQDVSNGERGSEGYRKINRKGEWDKKMDEIN